MKERLIDYRANSLGAARDIRKRLQMAKPGDTINIICNEKQVIKLLREITDYNGIIVDRNKTDKDVYIVIRKV